MSPSPPIKFLGNYFRLNFTKLGSSSACPLCETSAAAEEREGEEETRSPFVHENHEASPPQPSAKACKWLIQNSQYDICYFKKKSLLPLIRTSKMSEDAIPASLSFLERLHA